MTVADTRTRRVRLSLRAVRNLVRLLAIGATIGFAAPASAESISESRAREIAREAAGCKSENACVLRGGLRDGKWRFVVSFVAGRDPAGNPLFVPGGFVGVTVSRDGQVVDLMPGV